MKKFLLLTICSLFGFLPIIAQNGLAEDGWYEYTVNEGNLSELISEDLKYQITKLRLKGKINGDDLRLIRDMAGLPFQQISYDKGIEIDAQLTDGKLQYLDLGDTEICSGGNFLDGYGFSSGSLGVCIFQHSRSLIEVKGNKITEISSQAFNDCPNLKSVSFPNAIRLYNSVFKNCTSLQSVDLPLVDELYPDVFRECTSLTNIVLPNVKIIHLNCFTQCTSLKTISLPSATFLRQEVFSRCSALESVTAPNVTKLDDRVFWYCTALRNIELPALKSMGAYVFQFCSSLTSVTLENVEEINGFAGCESLVSVRCSNATRICDYAFQSCVSLETVDCPNVIHIASNAFSNCTSLKEIDWPNVIYIGPNAFSSCTSLKLIHIPNIEEIEERAFSGCETLSIANITSVKKIGDRAFFMCKLEDVSLPKVKKIGELVFYKNKLSTVEIGEYLDTIGYQAFSNTEIIRINNKKVPVISPNEGYIEPYNSGSFAKGLANIGTIIVPSESCNSYKNAEHWSEFSIRIIPDDVETHITADVEAQESTSGLLKNVGEEKLQNAIRLTLKGTINGYDIMLIRNKMPNLHFLDLTDVSIKANPYEYYQGYHSEDHRIGGYMFNGLHKLVELILPNNITYIGKNAFENCQFLKRITMYPGITNIDSYALSACKSLKRLVIPSGVLSINQHAFSSCEELDTVIIDEGLRVLGSQCFSWCYQLKHIQIPNSLEEIDRYCFQDCN